MTRTYYIKHPEYTDNVETHLADGEEEALQQLQDEYGVELDDMVFLILDNHVYTKDF